MQSRNVQSARVADAETVSIDIGRIAAVVRRRARILASAGFLLFLLFIMAGLFLIPQSFASRVSLSIVQGGGTPSLLTGLGLGGRSDKKYVGVLKSRWIADKVENRVHLRDLYGLRDEDDAIEMLTHSVLVDDNPADGLLYIQVSLPGPPAWRAGPGGVRARIKQTATVCADAYADNLRAYVINVDNDRELVLLRAAKQQLGMARAAYDRSIGKLASFVKRETGSLDVTQPVLADDAKTSTSTGGDTRSTSTAGGILQQLYTQKGLAEVEMRSLQAAMNAKSALVGNQIANVGTLPEEDPLLMSIRRAVLQADLELRELESQYGPDHPAVIVARQNAANLKKRLDVESRTVRRGLTTDRVQAQVQIRNLQTRIATLTGQIARAEARFQVSREHTTDFETLRSEVALRLEVLKQTASQAAILNLQTVSAQNRVAIIDRAQPPKKGTPGLAQLAAGSLALVIVLLAGRVALDYAREPSYMLVSPLEAPEPAGVS
jgi:uncharacterized protein involved in exopolysaccharide biosynthesis